MALEMLGKRVTEVAAKFYARALGAELNKVGLNAEDLIIKNKDVAEALTLSHPDVMKGRSRRLLRASDLVFKGKVYTDYKPESSCDPFDCQLLPLVEKIQARNAEMSALDLFKK